MASTSHGCLYNYVVSEYIFLGLILYYQRMSHSQTAAMSFLGSLRFSFETTRGEEWRRIRIYVRQMIYTRGFFFSSGELKTPKLTLSSGTYIALEWLQSTSSQAGLSGTNVETCPNVAGRVRRN